MKKIVVTGALGHIGSRLVRYLPVVFPSAQIVMIDNLSTQRYASLFNLPPEGKYRFIEGDVLSDDLAPLIQGADCVIHLAAVTNAAGSFAIREKVERENFTGTERVAMACLKAGARMIGLSSTSVYGTQGEVVDEDCPECDLRPQSPYAETKMREENLLRKLHAERGLGTVIVRFGTIFGTSPGMRFHTAVNKFCWQAVFGQPISVWKTAYHQKRPYLDLGDALRALTFLIRNGIFNGETYNVLTLNTTVFQITETIKEFIPGLTIEFVDAAIMNQLSYDVSDKKFRSLGFETMGDIRAGIKETIDLLKGGRPYFMNAEGPGR